MNLKKSICCILLVVVMVGCFTNGAGARNSTSSKAVFIMGKQVANIEARIYLSNLRSNVLRTKVTFDAVSSSWVFDCNKRITNHTNTLELIKNGASGSLSCSTDGKVGVSLKKESSSVCKIVTNPVNSTYRGINTYDNTVTRSAGGAILNLLPVVDWFTNVTITAKSSINPSSSY